MLSTIRPESMKTSTFTRVVRSTHVRAQFLIQFHYFERYLDTIFIRVPIFTVMPWTIKVHLEILKNKDILHKIVHTQTCAVLEPHDCEEEKNPGSHHPMQIGLLTCELEYYHHQTNHIQALIDIQMDQDRCKKCRNSSRQNISK